MFPPRSPDRASGRRRVVPATARRGILLAVAGLALVTGCTTAAAVPVQSTPDVRAGGAAAAACPVRVVGAGDMNVHSVVRETGALARAQNPAVVAALGDLQYPSGSLAGFLAQYDRTGWGELKGRTRPVPGNHEYRTPGAAGYFAYFGDPPRYYGYNLGCGWRGYALNSEIPVAEQARWLRRDLAAFPGVSVLAYWHKPRYSSGVHHGSDPGMQPFLDALAGRRGIVLNGHEHHYERFAVRAGLRQFVVGSGGSSRYPFGSTPVPGSARRIRDVPGVLVLSLGPGGSYGWSFRDRAGGVRDSGRG